jgi:hypothetical protein
MLTPEPQLLVRRCAKLGPTASGPRLLSPCPPCTTQPSSLRSLLEWPISLSTAFFQSQFPTSLSLSLSPAAWLPCSPHTSVSLSWSTPAPLLSLSLSLSGSLPFHLPCPLTLSQLKLLLPEPGLQKEDQSWAPPSKTGRCQEHPHQTVTLPDRPGSCIPAPWEVHSQPEPRC